MLTSKPSSIQRTSCPKCGQCPFVDGVCEQKIARGRRFFLLGALALPVAAKIESLGKLVKPAYETPTIEYLGNIWTWSGPLFAEGNWLEINNSGNSDGKYIVTKVNERFQIEMKMHTRRA